jgi:uncharacterized protein YcfL
MSRPVGRLRVLHLHGRRTIRLCTNDCRGSLDNMRKILGLFVTICVTILMSCQGAQVNKPNQKQRFVSPSGRYILNVPIEEADEGKNHYWRVTISDNKGTIVFKDDSPLFARFNVYWYWDKSDRVWLVNSDNGNTYYWEVDENGQWQRTQWQKENSKGLVPPRELYPEAWGVKN